MLINRDFLCNIEAQAAAKAILSGTPLADLPAPVGDAAQYIATAVKEGWFIIPFWKSGHYCQRQFSSVTGALASHPDLPEALQEARAAVITALSSTNRSAHEIFGTARAGRFQSPVEIIERAPYHCPRMPLTFEAGKFTAHEFCDLLDDITAKCAHARRISKALLCRDFFDPRSCLFEKSERLIQSGLREMVYPLIRNVHQLWLDLPSLKSLDDFIYGRITADQFKESLKSNDLEKAQAEEKHWTRIRMKVAGIAGVFSDLTSYSQASLTKALRLNFGPRYCVKKIKAQNGTRLVIEMDETAELGQSSVIESPFLLANWVMKLDMSLPKVVRNYATFIEGLNEADLAVKRLSREMAA